jgi:hypothetical protein
VPSRQALSAQGTSGSSGRGGCWQSASLFDSIGKMKDVHFKNFMNTYEYASWEMREKKNMFHI